MSSPIKEFQGEYRWLSNFWPSPIPTAMGTFPTVEHAYQASKFADEKHRKMIRACPTPGQAKRLARTLPMSPDFEKRKLGYMYELVAQKFRTHKDLAAKLLATGDRLIYEGNGWHDLFWGVDKHTGEGANHLGKILMQVRAELQRVATHTNTPTSSV